MTRNALKIERESGWVVMLNCPTPGDIPQALKDAAIVHRGIFRDRKAKAAWGVDDGETFTPDAENPVDLEKLGFVDVPMDK